MVGVTPAAGGVIEDLVGEEVLILGVVGGAVGVVQAQPGSGDRCFTTGMAGANHDQVEGFDGGAVEAHGFIIGAAPFL